MKEQLKALLLPENSVQFAYLFGSYANGGEKEGSDVDIALYTETLNLDEKLALHHRLQKALGKEIDIVYLNEVRNIYLLESILKEGTVVKDHPERDFFEVMKQHEIIDFKNFRKYIDAA